VKLKMLFPAILVLVMCGMAKAQKPSTPRIIDTAITYKWLKEDIIKIGLKDLMRSSDQVYFRFWCKNQLVEIWTSDQNSFQGKLVSYTSKYDPQAYSNPGKKEKIFTNHIDIDPSTAKRIYERATEVELFNIPPQANIKGWQQGTDGYSVSLEYSDPLKYSMKYYWSPAFQVALPEAKLINEFEAFLETTLGLREKWAAFIDGLPKGCYHTGGLAVICTGRKAARKLHGSR
jgi:hypothetical protein